MDAWKTVDKPGGKIYALSITGRGRILMFGIGMPELIVILIVALIVIGPKRLPDIAKALGKGVSEFKRAMDGVKEELQVDEIRKEAGDLKNSLLYGSKEKPEEEPLQAEDRKVPDEKIDSTGTAGTDLDHEK